MRAAIPDVPWRSVRGFRNIVVHAYFAIDWKAVWDTARTDVPDIEPRVLDFLRRHYPEIAKRFDEDQRFSN